MFYMGVVPLAIGGVVFGVYKLLTHAPKVTAAPAGDNPNGRVAQDNVDEAERGWTLNVVASSLHTSAGSTTSEVFAALQAGDIPFELDPDLKDDDGFPVFAARIADLDVADMQEAFAKWQKLSAHSDLQWTEGQYRALHLATLSVSELASQVIAHPQVLLFAASRVEGRMPKEDTVPPLRLIGLWPAQWSDAHHALASGWIKWLLTEQGWPAHRLVVQSRTQEQSNPIAVLDALCVSSHRSKAPTLGVLVACDSGIDQEYVDALVSRGYLFGGKRMQGCRPGEVAAALLFADSVQSQLITQGPVSSLHRASWASREKSADERGRISADLLNRLVGLALEASKLEAAKIQLVSVDSDHNPARESELADMLTEKFPDLDLAKDAIKVAQACGSMHQVTTTAALCLAHQYVVDEQQAAVCASLHDAMWRAAVVLNAPSEAPGQEKADQKKTA